MAVLFGYILRHTPQASMVIEGCNASVTGAHSCKFSRGWLAAVSFLVTVG